MKIQDSVALVTGANRGLGLAFTQALLAGGARKVYAAARDPASVTLPGVEAIRLDVTKPEEVAAAARALGDVTLVINNAGIARGSALPRRRRRAGAARRVRDQLLRPAGVSRAFAPILAKQRRRRDRQRAVGAVVGEHAGLGDLLRVQVGGVVAEQRPAQRAARAGHAGAGAACRLHGHRHGAQRHGAEDQAGRRGRAQTLAALEAGKSEVLADEVSRRIKQNLSAEPGVYLVPPVAA